VTAPLVVLDASVGVKWFKDEPGSDEASGLLRSHGRGELRLVVPVVFMHEVLDVARRRLGPETARALLARLDREALAVIDADTAFLDAALVTAARLGCSVYDAAAPTLAQLLGVQLVSADSRAHSTFPGVRLIG